MTIATNHHVADVTYCHYGVAVGLIVIVGVAVSPVAVAIGLPDVAVVTLVGLLTGGIRLGVMDVTGVNAGVQVGVTGSSVGGGQICSRTVNWWQSLPWHTSTLREVLLGARQSTICLSRNLSTVLQTMLISVAVNAEGVGERTVKVAAAGMTTKAWVNVSMQNWHISSAVVGPVTGIPAVTVVVGPIVNVIVGVLVVLMVGVEIACVVAVGVGDACCPAQAVVSNTSINAPNKNKREIFFILSSPFFQILCEHEYVCLK